MFFCFVLFLICFLSLRYYKIVTSNENYSTVLSKLRDEGVNFEPDNGSELLPLTTVEVANLCSVLFLLCHNLFLMSNTDRFTPPRYDPLDFHLNLSFPQIKVTLIIIHQFIRWENVITGVVAGG